MNLFWKWILEQLINRLQVLYDLIEDSYILFKKKQLINIVKQIGAEIHLTIYQCSLHHWGTCIAWITFSNVCICNCFKSHVMNTLKNYYVNSLKFFIDLLILLFISHLVVEFLINLLCCFFNSCFVLIISHYSIFWQKRFQLTLTMTL